MKAWTFYDATTGASIGQTFQGPEETLAQNTPAGSVAIEGMFDYRISRLDIASGKVYPWRPEQPDEHAVWSDRDLRWVTLGERTTAARRSRLARLAACDWTQVADAPTSDEQRAAWATYRQALRDVPLQSGFPDNVTWPEEPK